MFGLTIISAFLLAISIHAQNLPSCAQSCVTNYNGCNQLDVACICGSSDWISTLACCVSQICDAADQDETIKFADKICAGVGITTLPQTATCTSGASSASVTPSSTRLTPVSQDGSSVVATSAATSSNTSAPVSNTASATTSATTSAATSATPSATTSSTASTSPSTATAKASSTGAANLNKGVGVGMAAVVAGLAVAL